jgi:hypothetical protein
MGGDYTRFTFDPKKHYAGVLKQQGRVDLDADWNELVEIMDRRWRAETVDIIGTCVVPRKTPNGFRIELEGGDLFIYPGRIYVDGLLVENHGKDPWEWNDALSEIRGQTRIPYNEQPYLKNPPKLPESGRYLAYLDAWQREVTYLEDPDLLEKALGGPDTTTRLQTVWQVRLLDLSNTNLQGCTDDLSSLDEWRRLTEPPAGRLTVSSQGPPASDLPCEIFPAGGYRGLENRLYRVEIHTPGGLEGETRATFKWSRDNGSVVAAVEDIATDGAQSRLTVSRIGRDQVLRFHVDDWVEVLDDYTELEVGPTGQKPGHLARVVDLNEAARTITLEPAIPGDLVFDPTDAERHTRVRRWDCEGPQNVGAGPLDLEDGIQISFLLDPDSGVFKSGDYWVFPARTADGTVGPLENAPPRGIHHHYGRLAEVTFPDIEHDCRTLWPPEMPGEGCDCTVCVTAESHNQGTLTIQMAIDQVRTSGGTVCLGAGWFSLQDLINTDLFQSIRIHGGQSIRLKGQGYKTVLYYLGNNPAIDIRGSIGITVEDLAFFTQTYRDLYGAPGVSLSNSFGVTLQHCYLLQWSLAGGSWPAISLAGVLFETTIRENVMYSPVGIDIGTPPGTKIPYILTAGLTIRDNLFLCQMTGIHLGAGDTEAAASFNFHLGKTSISDNLIYGCSEAGITFRGAFLPGSGLEVGGNEVRVSGDGIVVGADGARISGNIIRPLVLGQGGNGITLVPAGSLFPLSLDRPGLERCQIQDNCIAGFEGYGIVLRAPVLSALICQNVIEGVGRGGIVMEGASGAQALNVENNQLLNLAPLATQPAVGIRLVNVRQGEVSSNAIQGLGQQARISSDTGPDLVGIMAIACNSIRISGNEVVGFGPTARIKDSAGIDVLPPFDRLDVVDNQVRRTPLDTPDISELYALRIGRRAVEGGFYEGMLDEHILFRSERGRITYVVNGESFSNLSPGRQSMTVRGNTLEVQSGSPAVDIAGQVTPWAGECVFTDNRCTLEALKENLVIKLAAGALIFSNNYIQGPGHENFVADLSVGEDKKNPGPFTILGNIANGRIRVNGALLAAPWKDLNVTG